jgi:hypothetical protein
MKCNLLSCVNLFNYRISLGSFFLSKWQKTALVISAFGLLISVPFVRRITHSVWDRVKAAFETSHHEGPSTPPSRPRAQLPSLPSASLPRLASPKIRKAIARLPLPSVLSKLCQLNKEFSTEPEGTRWMLIAFKLFETAHIEESCNPCVAWEGCSDVC